MICSNCGKDAAYIRETTQAFGKGDKLVVIEGVPVERCHNCDTELLANDTAHKLDQLIQFLRANPASRANERTVKVACFQESPAPAQPNMAEHQTEAGSQIPSLLQPSEVGVAHPLPARQDSPHHCSPLSFGYSAAPSPPAKFLSIVCESRPTS